MTNSTALKLLVVAAIAVIAASVWGVSRAERSAGSAAHQQNSLANAIEIAMLELETNLRGYAQTGHASYATAYDQGGQKLWLTSERLAATDLDERLRKGLDRQAMLARRWKQSADDAMRRIDRQGPGRMPVRKVLARSRVMTAFRDEVQRFHDRLGELRASRSRRNGRIEVGLIVVLSLLFGGIAYVVATRTAAAGAKRRDAEARHRRAQGEFASALQVTRNEGEANALLKRHVERTVPGSDVVVLNRNNSDDRLEPATPVSDEVAELLDGARPDSCLALRLGRTHEHVEGADALLECELCGKRPGRTTCTPSLVGGEVIGTLLLHHVEPLRDAERRGLEESVGQAAPVLANLRNLAMAETRASTDALTGLPNNRAVQETFRRMAAQAGRTLRPMAAVLLDLDHFKRINDTEGHDRGDDVLAAVGQTLTSSVRDSDFAGRYGGEEFILLLPDTDAAGAVALAEKVRTRIAALDVPGVHSRITASFGVAILPDHAADVEKLLRSADRALYRAKGAGRNRVHVFEGGQVDAPQAPVEAASGD